MARLELSIGFDFEDYDNVEPKLRSILQRVLDWTYSMGREDMFREEEKNVVSFSIKDDRPDPVEETEHPDLLLTAFIQADGPYVHYTVSPSPLPDWAEADAILKAKAEEVARSEPETPEEVTIRTLARLSERPVTTLEEARAQIHLLGYSTQRWTVSPAFPFTVKLVNVLAVREPCSSQVHYFTANKDAYPVVADTMLYESEAAAVGTAIKRIKTLTSTESRDQRLKELISDLDQLI